MWRSICAMVLVSSVALAQSEDATATAGQSPQNTRPDMTKAKSPSYRQYTFYTQIRQGTTERAAIALSLQGFVTSPRSIVPRVIPLRLELQSADGITVKDVDYPKPRRQTFAFRPEPIPVTFAQPIKFKVHAPGDSRLGIHTLTGKLTFQIITNRGISAPQSIDVQFPVTVVAHGAQVHRADWPDHEMNRAALVTLIVLSPVLIAALIPIMAICTIVAGTPVCE